MKIILFAFKSADQMKMLKDRFGDLGIDCHSMITSGMDEYIMHPDAVTPFWKSQFDAAKETAEEFRIVCNNGDFLNWFLNYADLNNVDVDIKTVNEENNIQESYLDLTTGALMNWSYGYMMPKEPNADAL